MRRRTLRLYLLLAVILGATCGLVIDATAAPADAPVYLGDAVCLTCHEALHEGFTADYAKTIHAKALTPENALDAQSALGCEACHGPGSAHVAPQRRTRAQHPPRDALLSAMGVSLAVKSALETEKCSLTLGGA
jgi:hypothetical protein